MNAETEHPDGYELRLVAKFFAAGIGVAELAFLVVFVGSYLVPVVRAFPAVPFDLAVRSGVFLLIMALAQVLFVPLFVQLYRFPE